LTSIHKKAAIFSIIVGISFTACTDFFGNGGKRSEETSSLEKYNKCSAAIIEKYEKATDIDRMHKDSTFGATERDPHKLYNEHLTHYSQLKSEVDEIWNEPCSRFEYINEPPKNCYFLGLARKRAAAAIEESTIKSQFAEALRDLYSNTGIAPSSSVTKNNNGVYPLINMYDIQTSGQASTLTLDPVQSQLTLFITRLKEINAAKDKYPTIELYRIKMEYLLLIIESGLKLGIANPTDLFLPHYQTYLDGQSNSSSSSSNDNFNKQNQSFKDKKTAAKKALCDFLGIPINSTDEEIQSAYRKKARELHPDKGGKQEDMQKLNNLKDAYFS
jgi:hypothetical protein